VRGFVKVVLALTMTTVGVVLPLSAAFASASGGDGPGGTVTVGASDGGSSSGSPGGLPSGGGAAGGTNSWTCTSTPLVLNDGGGVLPGGPTPGGWFSVTCTDSSTGATTTQTEWIPNQVSPSTPAVDPRQVALQAENSLDLPAPSLHFNPSTTSVVNLATWLWIGAGLWHAYVVTASVGSVSATAVATPISVAWSMGDGGEVTCDGPGQTFDPAQPSVQQMNPCAYTYAVSSAGQPSPDGNPDDASFEVHATVAWSVSWTAQGAAGGGALPGLSTTASARVRVEQVESINSGLVRPTNLGPLDRAMIG
jgi:hypothetical protein